MTARKHKGISLISTLVGMVIAMIAVTAVMASYQNTLATIVPATQNAQTDGQRVAGLLRANKLLQGAGYGITAATFGSDIVILSVATLSGSTLSGTSQTGSSAVGNAVVWGMDTGAGYTCEGLYADSLGGLQRLVSVSCTAATQFGSLTWTAETMVDDTRTHTITATSEPCNPYGVAEGTDGAAVGDRTVTMSTTMSTQDASNAYADVPVSLTTCLANFYPAP